MEEDLRQAACFGNLHAVKKLLKSGVNINSQNNMNGWSALHWAAKRGHASIVVNLLHSGADVSIKTHKGEVPLQLTTSSEVRRILLSRSSSDEAQSSTQNETEELPIVPNYLQNPVFPYYDVKVEQDLIANEHNMKDGGKANDSDPLANGVSELSLSSADGTGQSELTVKVRVLEIDAEDFAEVEVPSLTYQSLFGAICAEFELAPSSVAKIRKLPNVLVRKDKDVQRLKEGQELEVILNSSN